MKLPDALSKHCIITISAPTASACLAFMHLPRMLSPFHPSAYSFAVHFPSTNANSAHLKRIGATVRWQPAGTRETETTCFCGGNCLNHLSSHFSSSASKLLVTIASNSSRFRSKCTNSGLFLRPQHHAFLSDTRISLYHDNSSTDQSMLHTSIPRRRPPDHPIASTPFRTCLPRPISRRLLNRQAGPRMPALLLSL